MELEALKARQDRLEQTTLFVAKGIYNLEEATNYTTIPHKSFYTDFLVAGRAHNPKEGLADWHAHKPIDSLK